MGDGQKARNITTGQQSHRNNEVLQQLVLSYHNLFLRELLIQLTIFVLQNVSRVNLDNIDIDKPHNGRSWAKVIDSPRSLEAFKRAGIYAKELDPVDINNLENVLKRRFGTQ